MTRKELIEKIKHRYPNALGCIVTGSQTHSQSFVQTSDIDIVLFDPVFSDTMSVGTIDHNYRIDVTIVPVLDIANVLFNESHEARGTLLSMIVSGHVLYDTDNGLTETIRETTKSIYNKRSIRATVQYKKIEEAVGKIIKYLRTPVGEAEHVFLLCELVQEVTILEVLRISRWEDRRLRKAQFLVKAQPQFSAALSTALVNAISTRDSTDLINYVQFHMQRFPTPATGYINPTVMFDWHIPDFVLFDFIVDTLPKLLATPKLMNAYRYFFLSDKKYGKVYKYQVSIAFAVQGDEDLLALSIALGDQIELIFGKKLPYNVIQPKSDLSESLYVALCRLKVFVIQQGRPEIISQIGLYFMLLIYQQFKFSAQDFISLNTLLIQRWIFDKDAQVQARNYNNLIRLEKEIIGRLQQEFLEQVPWVTDIEACARTGTLPAAFGSIGPKLFESVMHAFTTHNSNQVGNQYWYPAELLELYGIKMVSAGLHYLAICQCIFDCLDLANKSKASITYVAKQIIMERSERN